MKQQLFHRRSSRFLVIGLSFSLSLLFSGCGVGTKPRQNRVPRTTVLQQITQTKATINRVTLKNNGDQLLFPQSYKLPRVQIAQGLLVSPPTSEKFPLAVAGQSRSIGTAELQLLTQELVAGGSVGPQVDFGFADGSSGVNDQTALTSNLAFELGGLTYRQRQQVLSASELSRLTPQQAARRKLFDAIVQRLDSMINEPTNDRLGEVTAYRPATYELWATQDGYSTPTDIAWTRPAINLGPIPKGKVWCNVVQPAVADKLISEFAQLSSTSPNQQLFFDEDGRQFKLVLLPTLPGMTPCNRGYLID
jgi:hypothetical protein